MPRLTKWLNGLVKSGTLAVLLWSPFVGAAQERPTLTLQQAFSLAEQQYPLTGQKALLHQTEDLTLQNLNTGYLPEVQKASMKPMTAMGSSTA